jgi:benzoyl-CoA reductase/2-hydroxyglutaryl-CoA dehydratase subunit BcrC/BadD/HgdB
MIKVMAGRLKLRGTSTINKILYFGATCEPHSSSYEHAARLGYDVHCIEAVTAFRSQDKRPEIISFLANEMQKVAIWLTGKEVDQDRLTEEIRRRNVILRKTKQITDLRLKAPLYLGAVPTNQLLQGSSHGFGRYDEYVQTLDLIIDELKEAAKTPTAEPYIPLVMAGGGVGGPGIFHVIEESRGAVLGWLVVGTGEYREDVPPLESIAHYVLDAQAKGELGEGAGTSSTLRRFRIEELVRDVGAKGIISSSITGCPYGSIVQQMEREHFKKLGIPIIQLEGTVHRGRPSEEQIMRVRTFVEMI